MFDEFLAHLRNMDQTILMHTDIHKSTKVNNIADSSLKNHALF